MNPATAPRNRDCRLCQTVAHSEDVDFRLWTAGGERLPPRAAISYLISIGAAEGISRRGLAKRLAVHVRHVERSLAAARSKAVPDRELTFGDVYSRAEILDIVSIHQKHVQAWMVASGGPDEPVPEWRPEWASLSVDEAVAELSPAEEALYFERLTDAQQDALLAERVKGWEAAGAEGRAEPELVEEAVALWVGRLPDAARRAGRAAAETDHHDD